MLDEIIKHVEDLLVKLHIHKAQTETPAPLPVEPAADPHDDIADELNAAENADLKD